MKLFGENTLTGTEDYVSISMQAFENRNSLYIGVFKFEH